MFGIQGTKFEYDYCGYQYRTYDDIEDDNIKTFHLCYKDGIEVKEISYGFFNTSPYSLVAYDDFRGYIDILLNKDKD